MNENRAIPFSYNGSDTTSIKEIIELKTRYVMLEITDQDIFYVISAFYKLGLRKGDIYIVSGDNVLNENALNPNFLSENDYKIRVELMEGLISIGFNSYDGEIGEDVKKKFEKTYNTSNDYMCLFYDAVYLGANAADFLLQSGLTLNNKNMQTAIKLVNFVGCSEKIKISRSGNDRTTIKLMLKNLVKVDSEFIMNSCGIYDPSLTDFYESLAPFSWFNAEGKLPVDIIGSDYICGFDESEIRDFSCGYYILVGIGIFPIVLGGLGFWLFFSHVYYRCYPMLDTVQDETMLDTVMYFTIIIENIQYLAIGPNFIEFFPQLETLTRIATFDLRGSTALNSWTYWTQLEMVCILAFIWTILLIDRRIHFTKHSR